MSGDSLQNELVNVVLAIQEECWPCAENQNSDYLKHQTLFRPDIRDHPIPFFGDLINAEVLTVAVNPSSTEFAPWRNWGSERMAAKLLAERLVGYFLSTHPKPHPWFGEIEAALNILKCSYMKNAAHLDLSPRATRAMRSFQNPNQRRQFLTMLKNDMKWLVQLFSLVKCPKLVIFVGSVIDQQNSRGVGVGEFISRQAPDFWKSLAGRRWPQTACSKSLLAEHVFKNRIALLKLLNCKPN